MINRKNKTQYIALLVLMVIVSFGVFGAESFGLSAGDNEVESTNDNDSNIEENEISSNFTIEMLGTSPHLNEDANIERDNERVVIYGSIIGNTGGQTTFIDSVDHNNDEIEVNIDTKKPDEEDIAVPQVVLGYDYKLSVEKEDIGEQDIIVNHIDGEQFYFEYNPIEPVSNDLSYEFKSGSEYRTDDSGINFGVNEDQIEIYGSFVTGSSTCSKAGLQSIEITDGKLDVSMSPTSKSTLQDICTHDISPDDYLLQVYNMDNISEIEVTAETAMGEEINESFKLNE